MTEISSFPPPLPPKRTSRRSFPALRAIGALILREMSTTYGKSPGGYIWAFVEPVASIVFLTIVFQMFMRNPPIGNSYAMFYATGVLTFGIYSHIQAKTSQALLFSKALLGYPTVTFIDAIAARVILALITDILVAYVVFIGAMVFSEGWMRVDILTVAIGFGMAAFLGLGIGCLNAFINMKLPVWQQFWGVLTRPLMLISGVIILHENIPEPYKSWLSWNPIVHCVGLVRRGFYESYDGDYISVVYVALIALVCLTLGLLFLRAHYRDMLANN